MCILPTYLLLSNIAVSGWEDYNFFRIVFYDLINLIKARVFRALNSEGGGGRIPRTLSKIRMAYAASLRLCRDKASDSSLQKI